MISLLLAQLAARWGQAMILLLLSLAATMTAAGAPAYARAVDQAAASHELANADPAELVVTLPVVRQSSDDPVTTSPYRQALAALPDFTPVASVDIDVQELGDDSVTYRLIGQDGFCGYVVFQAGRCPVGSREVALPAPLADELGRRPGEVLTLTPVVTGQFGTAPDGPPVELTLVGTFTPADPDDPYWTVGDPLGTRGFPLGLLTNRTVLRTVPHGPERLTFAAVLPADRLTAEAVPALRDQLAAAAQRVALGAGPGDLTSDLPHLLDRITGHGAQARALLPIAAAPLVALCWFVIYLAAGQAAAGRRREIGVVAVRGVTPWTRVGAVAAESGLPVLAGFPAGLVLLPALLGLAGPGNGPVGVDLDQLLAAALATAGGLVAVLAALWRELTGPVARLLRWVPPRRRATIAVVEVLAVLLAVVVVVDLRWLDGELVGVLVVAPALVILAVAALATRALRPVIDLAGRWALRRGRLGPALAGLYLARLPGVSTLLVVLALGFGTLGFTVTTVDMATQGRAAAAERSLGAARVLSVQQIDRGGLLAAVRAADPAGEYAMAVLAALGAADEPPRIAVDTPRLAQVAVWAESAGPLGPAEVAALLRPPAPEPVRVEDGELVADLDIAGLGVPDETLTVTLTLAPVAGERAVRAQFGPLTADRSRYRSRVTGCPDGCALTQVTVRATTDTGHELDRFDVTLRGLRQADRDVLPAEWLRDAGRWRGPEQVDPADQLRAGAVSDGMRFSKSLPAPDVEYPLLTVDAPYPLPVVTTGEVPGGSLLVGVDNQVLQVDRRATLDALPGVGTAGVLMDLEYAERLTAAPGQATSPQVWLAATAPAEVVERLTAQGLVIVEDRSVARLQESASGSGAALALRFYLFAGALAVLVGLVALLLVAAVDRRTWAAGLRGLRIQGLAGSTATWATWWSYGGVVLAGALVGAAATAVAWLGTGQRLPAGVDPAALTRWPQWTEVLTPWGAAVVVALAAALVIGWWQRSAVRATREVNG